MELIGGNDFRLNEGQFLTEKLPNNILLIKWVGYCNADDYRFGFLRALEISGDLGIEKWLMDFSEIKVISPQNQKWTISILIEKVGKTGVKKIAIVYPQCGLANASIENMYKEFQTFISYDRKVVFSREEGEKWLDR